MRPEAPMPMVNAEIAADLNKLADLLDIEGANPFRVRAYRRAARVVQGLPRAVTDMLAAGENLDALPGIGPDLAAKIATLARGGELPQLTKLERALPPGIAALLAVPGLGPKRVHALHTALGIDSPETLAAAARAGTVRTVPGFGPGLEKTILRGLAEGALQQPRVRLDLAEQVATPLLAWLRGAPGIGQAALAGSLRRRRETVGDLDIVAEAAVAGPIMDRFVAYADVARVIERGPTRATVRLRGGLQVDLRVVPEASFGAALCYFTGSRAHSIALRRRALARGLKLNEYGLFSGRRGIAGRTEAELYGALGLACIPPELREGEGEIEAAETGRLPRLVALSDLRGDLHVHTDTSDGGARLATMAAAAQALGHAYIAVTDHSRSLGMARGLDPDRLARQIAAIATLNTTLRDFTVLAGIEVDILEDGRLDLPDNILSRLDLVIAAIRSHFELPPERQTERILRAMDNRFVTILAHPTGRMIGRRPAYALDMERVMRAARERNCCLEVNAQPERLDLDDAHCRLAKEIGVKLAISTDAHSTAELGLLQYGIDQARRGWITAADVVNTRPLPALRATLRRG